jgi:hypothetical protein
VWTLSLSILELVVTNRDTSPSLTKILLQFSGSYMIAPSLLPASRTSMPVHSWEADALPYRPRETLEEKRNDVSSDPCCFRAAIVLFFLGACRTNARANKEAEHSGHGGRHRGGTTPAAACELQCGRSNAQARAERLVHDTSRVRARESSYLAQSVRPEQKCRKMLPMNSVFWEERW